MNVTVAPLTEMVPAADPTVMAAVVTVAGCTGREKVMVTVAAASTWFAPSAGLTCATASGVELGGAQVESVGAHESRSSPPHAARSPIISATRPRRQDPERGMGCSPVRAACFRGGVQSAAGVAGLLLTWRATNSAESPHRP